MFMSDAILGYTTLVIEIVGCGLDGMDNCHKRMSSL